MFQQSGRAFLGNPRSGNYGNYGYANNDRVGFLGPFLLGGITGGLVAPFFYGGGGYGYNQPYYTNNYYYPPYSYYGYRPY